MTSHAARCTHPPRLSFPSVILYIPLVLDTDLEVPLTGYAPSFSFFFFPLFLSRCGCFLNLFPISSYPHSFCAISLLSLYFFSFVCVSRSGLTALAWVLLHVLDMTG